MKIKVRIDGIAIVYYHEDRGVYKVLFPFDSKEKHGVQIKKDLKPQRPIMEANRTVTVAADPPMKSLPPGQKFDEFIDLTASYAHPKGIEILNGWEGKAVILTLNNATFYRGSLTNCHFAVHDSNGATQPHRLIGYDCMFEVEGDRIEILMDGSEVPDYKSPISVERGTSITFSNHCDKCPSVDQGADFKMIYEIIQESGNPLRRLTIDRQGDEKPGQAGVVRKGLLSKAAAIKVLAWLAKILAGSSFFPIGILNNPLAGQDGLPCNILVASDSKKLP